MNWLLGFYRSTIGKKVVMAVTGLVLLGYLVVHALGNLLIFRGPEAINRYAEFLKANPPLVWGVRLALLAALALHVHAAWALTRRNRAARPVGYERLARHSSTVSALSLRIGGVVLFGFIVFHLLHLTTGTVHPAFSPIDVYGNVMIGLSVPWVAGFYVVAMAALALHLHHGVWSLVQTLGFSHPHVEAARRWFGTLVAVLVAGGFVVIPLAVVLGLIR